MTEWGEWNSKLPLRPVSAPARTRRDRVATTATTIIGINATGQSGLATCQKDTCGNHVFIDPDEMPSRRQAKGKRQNTHEAFSTVPLVVNFPKPNEVDNVHVDGVRSSRLRKTQ